MNRKNIATETDSLSDINIKAKENNQMFAMNDLNRYKLLFESAQNALLFMLPDGSIFEANDSALSVYGYSREELLTKKIYELRADRNNIEYSQIDEALMRKGIMLETIHKRKDGTTFPIESLTRNAVINNEKILMSTIKDISERKEQEKEKDKLLEQLENKYNMEKKISYAARKFLDISHFGDSISFVLEQLGNFIGTDRTYLYMFKKGFFKYNSEWCDEGVESKIQSHRKTRIESINWLSEKLKYGIVVNFDSIEDMPEEAADVKESFSKSGIKSFLMFPIIISNELVGILGTEKIKNYIRWTDNDIYIANTIGELVTMSCIRKRVEDQLLERNEELRSTLETLSKAQQQLMQQEKLAGIGQLAAGIAHEINNPLGYIISNNEALSGYMKKIIEIFLCYEDLLDYLEKCPDPELRKRIIKVRELEQQKKLDFIKDDIIAMMGDIEEGLERISKLVKGLRFISHRAMEDEFEEYDLNQGLQNTLVVAKNEIKYYAEVKEDLGEIPCILAVGSQVNQVLLNMIINSVHAIKEKDTEELGLISIKTYSDKKNVYCEIEDSGSGIPKENLGKLFMPFYTTKPAGLGTGLGLAISYDIIVNTHGGNIKVESESGIGTKFTIILPIKLDIKEKDNS